MSERVCGCMMSCIEIGLPSGRVTNGGAFCNKGASVTNGCAFCNKGCIGVMFGRVGHPWRGE